MTKTIHIIAGPTASGKSALALKRAFEIDGTIINVDSRQIYDALPILSAQPTEEEKKQAPHLLYGFLNPNDTCSAGTWREIATPLIEKLLQEGKTPIITGGTGLYIKTLIEGISPIPGVPPEIREAANEKQKELGNPAFYAELEKRDPITAAQYHPMHTARLVHAWEILDATGKPLSYWQSLPKQAPPNDWRFEVTLVMPDRVQLSANFEKRFRTMVDGGALEELEAFDQKVANGEINEDAIVIKTIGAPALRAYREGRITKENAIELAAIETRQYAKRQTTWFNNQIKPGNNLSVTIIR